MLEYRYTLTHNGNREVLAVNPAGWDELGLKLVRSEIYHSLMRSLTLSLRFPSVKGGGYDFILNAYESEGINADIGVIIERLNHSTNGYELLYVGKIEIIADRFTISRSYVEAPIVDGMKQQRLISRDEVELNLFDNRTIDGVELAPIEPSEITLPPVDIVLEAKYENVGMRFDGQFLYDDNVVNATRREGDFKTYIKDSIASINTLGDLISVGTSELMYTNNSGGDVRVDVNLVGQCAVKITDAIIPPFGFAAWAAITRIDIYDKDNNIIERKSTSYHPSTNDEVNYIIDIAGAVDLETSIVIPSGGYIEAYNLIGVQTPSGFTWTTTDNSVYNFELVVNTLGLEETTAKCIFPFKAFTRAVQQVSSETNTSKIFASTVFSPGGEAANDAILSGLMIRNFPDVPLNVSIRNLFKTFSSIYGLGLGYDLVNDRFYIEKLSEFYQVNNLMVVLGEVDNLTISPAKHYFSTIKAGYEEKGDYEELQGAYELNVNREYSTEAPVKETLDVQAKYNADSVGIELARKKQYSATGSTDSRYDNKIYVINTDGQKPIIADATGFAGIEKYYNLNLSPRNNLLRWGEWLRATLFKMNGAIKFQKAEKNVTATINGVDDFSDITKNELLDQFFIPEVYRFEAPLTTAQIRIILNNPHGFVRFSYLGKQYEGFIEQLECGDYKNNATFTLMGRVPITDSSNYIFEGGTNYIFEDGTNFIFE